jgi:hypothetical protein
MASIITRFKEGQTFDSLEKPALLPKNVIVINITPTKQNTQIFALVRFVTFSNVPPAFLNFGMRRTETIRGAIILENRFAMVFTATSVSQYRV